ncbi:hypothetical protein SH501x_002858 [Pirellulaceae bacterium SH501]
MSMDPHQDFKSEIEQLRSLKPRTPKLDWELIRNASSNRLNSDLAKAERNVVYVLQPNRSAWLVWTSGVLVGAAAMFVAVKMMPVNDPSPRTRSLPSVESLASQGAETLGKPKSSELGSSRGFIRRADLRVVDQMFSLRDGLEIRILTATKLVQAQETSKANAEEANASSLFDESRNQPFALPRVITPKAWGSVLNEWDKPTT